MTRSAIPTWCFAVVVVRRAGRYVLVEENGNRGWYLPAGRIEPGETIVAGARREVLEEAGIAVELEGIVRVEHTPTADGHARLRIVLVAAAPDDAVLKRVADGESRRAIWTNVEDLSRHPLRSPEVESLLRYVDEGGRIHPLSLLAAEREPYSRR